MMEPEIRSIPLTLVDFLAVLIPGFVWIILLVSTFQLFIHSESGANPLGSIFTVASFVKRVDSAFFSSFSIVVASLLIGYLARPFAMRIAERLARFEFKLHKSTRNIPLKNLTFPFHDIHGKQGYCLRASEILSRDLGQALDNLAGHQPFSAAKRYLRIVAPSLFEESERMEAETRLAGAMLLASSYSLLLSAVAGIVYLAKRSVMSDSSSALLAWLVTSLVTMVILATNFNFLRNREIKYTYTNVVVAAGCSKGGASSA